MNGKQIKLTYINYTKLAELLRDTPTTITSMPNKPFSYNPRENVWPRDDKPSPPSPDSPYAILCVDSSTPLDKIRSMWRILVKKYHPDLNSDPSAREAFDRVQEAWEILGDPDKRRKYDAATKLLEKRTKPREDREPPIRYGWYGQSQPSIPMAQNFLYAIQIMPGDPRFDLQIGQILSDGGRDFIIVRREVHPVHAWVEFTLGILPNSMLNPYILPRGNIRSVNIARLFSPAGVPERVAEAEIDGNYASLMGMWVQVQQPRGYALTGLVKLSRYTHASQSTTLTIVVERIA